MLISSQKVICRIKEDNFNPSPLPPPPPLAHPPTPPFYGGIWDIWVSFPCSCCLLSILCYLQLERPWNSTCSVGNKTQKYFLLHITLPSAPEHQHAYSSLLLGCCNSTHRWVHFGWISEYWTRSPTLCGKKPGRKNEESVWGFLCNGFPGWPFLMRGDR